MTVVALKDLASLDLAVGRVTALWALEATGPAQLKKSVSAGRLTAVLFQKLDHAETFLKLNHIPRHLVTSCLSDGYKATGRPSQ